MQWPERGPLDHFIVPRSVMDGDGRSSLEFFPPLPPSFFCLRDEFEISRVRIEIGEIGSWHLSPSVGGDVVEEILEINRKERDVEEKIFW